MNFLLFLLYIFVFTFVSCEKPHQNTVDNENQNIPVSENIESYGHIKKAKEIENVENPYQVGQKDAQEDFLNKRFFIKMNGDPTKEAFEWGIILKEKHGIQIYNFGCCFSDKLDKYVQGYNEVSKAKIKEHFGRTVLEKSWKEASDKVNK